MMVMVKRCDEMMKELRQRLQAVNEVADGETK